MLIFFRESTKLSILKRYVLANSMLYQKSTIDFEEEKNIEIVFLVTKKDNKIFEFSLSYADKLAQNFEQPIITVITPSSNIDNLYNLKPKVVSQLRVLDEEIFLTEELKEKILKKFPKRYGWVLQQLIKIDFVRKSQAKGVMVIDADTFLLRNRKWLYKNEIQLITPTYEYHAPYYKILNKMLKTSVSPKFTFVSHHMIFQPKYMREIFSQLNWNYLIDICETVFPLVEDYMSPFSLDYELYAQYMFSHHADKVILGKWANATGKSEQLQIDRTLIESQKLSLKFFSISFHDYLSQSFQTKS